jgi:transcription antitermination factor NusG
MSFLRANHLRVAGNKMALAWYVLRSKPNKEDFFFDQLLAHRLEVYYPRIPVRTVNPRARKVRPYFPGYLFVNVDLDIVNPSVLHWMPGSAGLVTFDAEPASVPESLINAVRRRVDEINEAGGEQLDGLKPGDRVSIQGGPFSGYEAIFDAGLSGNERVRVLIKFLRGRQLPVELPTGFVQKKK